MHDDERARFLAAVRDRMIWLPAARREEELRELA